MKALAIAPQPFFSPRGTPFSVYYRTKAMARAGEDIDLLTYGQGSDVEFGDVRVIRTPRMQWLGHVPTGPSWRKAIHDIFIFFYTVGLLISNKYDYVHCHEESVFMARILKPIFGFKLLYDMHSSLPEQLSNFAFSKSKLLKCLFQGAERNALKISDAVIVVCPTLLEHAQRFVPDPSKVVLIENSQFDDVILRDNRSVEAPNGIIQEAASLAKAGNPIILYAGTLETYQGIDLLLEGFQLLTQHEETSRLLIVGGEPEQVAHYSDLARKLGVAGRCRFSGKVAQGIASSCNELASVLVSPRTSGTNTPMKIYPQMASGLPLLATRIESHTQVLSDDVATLVAPQADAIAVGLQEILGNAARANAKARKARELFEQKYSESMFMAKTAAVLNILQGQETRHSSASPSPE